MNCQGIIYKVCFPNNKIYIGQTIRSLKIRMAQHFARSKHDTIPFHNALKKYKENITWEIIDYSNNIVELNKKEIFYINLYKSNQREYGYNCDMGGNNKIWNYEIRQKISNARKKDKYYKICPICNKLFYSIVNKTCSIKCGYKLLSQKTKGISKPYKGSRGIKLFTFICKNCKKEFLRSKKGAIYCSNKCRYSSQEWKKNNLRLFNDRKKIPKF